MLVVGGIDASGHVPRSRHIARILPDGTVLVIGGTDDLSVAERYNPPPLGRR